MSRVQDRKVLLTITTKPAILTCHGLTPYHPASHCWLASEAKQGWSLDGRQDAAGGPVGGTLSSGLKNNFPMPVIGKGDT